MNRFIGVWVVVVVGLVTACNIRIPNLNNINLSGCIKTECDPQVNTCFNKVDARTKFCQSIMNGDMTTEDKEDCLNGVGYYAGHPSITLMTKQCLLDDQRCIADCVEDIEDQLKGIAPTPDAGSD